MIRIVERWAEVADPTVPAKIAQARAMFELGAVDRAAARLEEVLGRPDVPLDALLLAGRLFLARGWNDKARAPLQSAAARVDGRRADEVAELLALADRPAPELPEDPPESATDVALVLPLVDRLLAAGAQIRARRLLERLKRHHADAPELEDRLWVLDGDFSGGRASLAHLVDRYGPDLPTLVDLPNDDTEHTESISRAAAPIDLDDDPSGTPFPGLFRGETAPLVPGDDNTEEVTQSALLAPMPPPPPLGDKEGGDTQISRVIRNAEGDTLRRHEGEMHAPHAPTTGFDLSAWRREMGVTDDLRMPGDSDISFAGPTPLGGLEEEDESRVTLLPRPATPANTRRGTSDADFEMSNEVTGAIDLSAIPAPAARLPPPPGPRGGLALVNAILRQIRNENESPPPARPPKPGPREPAAEPVEDAAPTPARRPTRRWDPTVPIWALALAAMSLLLLFLLAALVVLNFVGWVT